MTAALGEDLDRRSHEQDEEENARRRYDQRSDEPCAVADRGDVAVTGRGNADARVVEGVEECDPAAGRIAVASAPEVGNERDEQDSPEARANRVASSRKGPGSVRGSRIRGALDGTSGTG